MGSNPTLTASLILNRRYEADENRWRDILNRARRQSGNSLATTTSNYVMRLVRWRWILPAVQLALYLVLVWQGCWYRPTWQRWLENWISPGTEPTGFVADWIDGVESLPEQAAAGLNFPAVAAAALSIVPFEDQLQSGASRELATHTLSGFYVLLLWYLIGKGIERRNELRASPLSKLKKALGGSAVAGLILLGASMLWNFAEGQRYTMSGLSLLWIVAGLVVLGTRLHLSRKQAISD